MPTETTVRAPMSAVSMSAVSPFFAIVRRDGVRFLLKAVGEGDGPRPNRLRGFEVGDHDGYRLFFGRPRA